MLLVGQRELVLELVVQELAGSNQRRRLAGHVLHDVEQLKLAIAQQVGVREPAHHEAAVRGEDRARVHVVDPLHELAREHVDGFAHLVGHVGKMRILVCLSRTRPQPQLTVRAHHHFPEQLRVLTMRRLHETFRSAVEVALVLERIHTREHRDHEIMVAAALVARLTGGKLEAFGPLAMLEHRAWRAMLDRRGRRASAAEGTRLVISQEGLPVSCRCAHG